MKKQLRFFFILLFFLLFAYILRPSSDYMEKLMVVKGISLAAEYKKAVGEYLAEYKELPTGEDWQGISPEVRVNLDESAVEKITVGDDGPGTVTIYYSADKLADAPPAINNTRIILTPQVFSGKITWTCRGTMPEEYRPNACQ